MLQKNVMSWQFMWLQCAAFFQCTFIHLISQITFLFWYVWMLQYQTETGVREVWEWLEWLGWLGWDNTQVCHHWNLPGRVATHSDKYHNIFHLSSTFELYVIAFCFGLLGFIRTSFQFKIVLYAFEHWHTWKENWKIRFAKDRISLLNGKTIFFFTKTLNAMSGLWNTTRCEK